MTAREMIQQLLRTPEIDLDAELFLSANKTKHVPLKTIRLDANGYLLADW